MSAAAFSIQCECGATLPISASDAGATVACKCGRALRVPRLSELRVSKGMDASETNICDTIARMIREGTLPWGQSCAVTGVQTDDVMLLDVECERSYVKGKASRRWGTVLLILGFFVCLPVAVFMWLIGADLFKTPSERVGRDIVITIPLRVSKIAQDELRRSSRMRLKNILRSVPIYERLLSEYPDAKIHPR